MLKIRRHKDITLLYYRCLGAVVMTRLLRNPLNKYFINLHNPLLAYILIIIDTLKIVNIACVVRNQVRSNFFSRNHGFRLRNER